MMPTLPTMTEWRSLSSSVQDMIVTEVGRRLPDLTLIGLRSYSQDPQMRIATFVHADSGVEFNLILGDLFSMGLSDAEIDAARQIDPTVLELLMTMQPSHNVKVRPFLISRLPVLECTCRLLFRGRPSTRMPFDSDVTDAVPCFLPRDEIEFICQFLGAALPSEAQWEYACRGGRNTLFYFGDVLPDQSELGATVLIHEFEDEELNGRNANAFGLIGIPVGTWCMDSYRSDYSHAPPDDRPVNGSPPFALRGGATGFWPWSPGSNTWIALISAFRTSSDQSVEGMWPARLVIQL